MWRLREFIALFIQCDRNENDSMKTKQYELDYIFFIAGNLIFFSNAITVVSVNKYLLSPQCVFF